MINTGKFSFLAVSDWLSDLDALSFIRENYPNHKNLGKVSCFNPEKFGMTQECFDEIRIKYKITDCHNFGGRVYYVFLS